MSLPSGMDRADGLNGRLGTPTPAAAIKANFKGNEGSVDDVVEIEELTDSPTFERAEQATNTKKFRMSHTEGLNRMYFLGRGLIRTDSFGNVFKLLSASTQHEKNDTCILTTTEESVSFDCPPDQFQIIPVELGVNIMKHPRYFYAFLGEGVGSATELKNQMVIRTLQDYFENPQQTVRDTKTELIFKSIGAENGGTTVVIPANPPSEPVARSIVTIAGTDLAKKAALEIIQKYWRGEETPYVVGYQITHSSFWFRPPFLNPGGYIEDPIYDASPQLPDYFWSPDFPPSKVTIFDQLAAINPQCYSSTGLQDGPVVLSWLRKADEVEYERTWFKVIRTWIGSPVGFWDTELYTAQKRPTTAAEFLTINPAKP